MLLQLTDAGLGVAHSRKTLHHERFADDAHRQGALLAGDLCNDRSSPGAGSSSHPRSDKDQVGILQLLDHLVAILIDRLAGQLRLSSGSQPVRNALLTDADDAVGRAGLQSLGIGVECDEIDSEHPRVDHAIDGVAPGPTHADHLNLRFAFVVDEIKRHKFPPPCENSWWFSLVSSEK